ncbi:hypothetical protein MGWOODY_Smn1256 [hydrothermal vent metagenome]|uniref:Uncharacterized protein n=1 Tax=hydrothermal vent metagenome TaxID=652676 RepID=A0A160TH67_9ZZZZ
MDWPVARYEAHQETEETAFAIGRDRGRERHQFRGVGKVGKHHRSHLRFAFRPQLVLVDFHRAVGLVLDSKDFAFAPFPDPLAQRKWPAINLDRRLGQCRDTNTSVLSSSVRSQMAGPSR